MSAARRAPRLPEPPPYFPPSEGGIDEWHEGYDRAITAAGPAFGADGYPDCRGGRIGWDPDSQEEFLKPHSCGTLEDAGDPFRPLAPTEEPEKESAAA